MKPKVYITRRIPLQGIAQVFEVCDVTVHDSDLPPTREEIISSIGDKDGIYCLLTDRIDREVLEHAGRLKVISTMSAGFEHIEVDEATRRGIYVGYTPGILTEATADLTFALILAAARRVVEADRFVRSGDWQISWLPTLFLGESLWGRTLGIIGMGRIGKAVTRRAKGFSMRVLYADRLSLSREEEKELGAEYCSLEELLQTSDIVSVHTPLTGETFHMIDETRLRLMKPTAILINTSRGSTVDETALVKALQEKWIAGAGLDVFEKEPVAPDNPLLVMGNVIILPHLGSATRQTRELMADLAARNLLSVFKGERPSQWLNPEVEKVKPLPAVKML
jgi:glyoxylate reductase